MANQKSFTLDSIGTSPVSPRELVKLNKFINCGLKGIFTSRGFTIKIMSGPIISDGLLQVSVEAQKNGKKLFVDNPLQYKNPPILVPDGNGKFKEDVAEALKEIITQTIEVTCK